MANTLISSDSITELYTRLSTIKVNINFEQKLIEYDELKIRTEDPNIWNNQDNAQHIFKDFKELEKLLYLIDNVQENIDDLSITFDFFKENEIAEEELLNVYNTAVNSIIELEKTQMFTGEADEMGAVLSINAGAGGTEANDWASMLIRMYKMWCDKHHFKYDITDFTLGDKVGFKSFTLQIEGKNAYGYLKSENGVHRMVRVSPFNAQGKRMTSFAAVFVTPLVDDRINIDIDESKLTWETFRSSGAGGQNVNKLETGVRARYLYTDPDTGETEEICVANTETRKQNDNKERARNILKSILYKKEMDKRLAAKKALEDTKLKNEWGAQIRSYVLDDKRVKDHRTDYQDNDTDSVLNGNLDEFMKQYLMKFKD